MVYYYYAGEKNKALQVYDQCQQVLSAELGVDPDISTRQLAERIRAGSLWSQKEISLYPPPNYEGRLYEVPYSLGKVPFSGRYREYAWLIHQWHALSNPIIWIEGEAGVGKTVWWKSSLAISKKMVSGFSGCAAVVIKVHRLQPGLISLRVFRKFSIVRI